MVKYTGAVVLAVDYRRPPEHPFPVPVEDCLQAYRWLLMTVDASRIVFAGDSAGGGLVIATMVAAKEAGLPLPARGLMISPWVNLEDAGESDSWTRNAPYDYLPVDLAQLFANSYRGSSSWAEVSPAQYPPERLRGLPPMLIEVGECEALHDQVLAFANTLHREGVDVKVNVREDMVHVFPLFAFTDMPQCRHAFAAVAVFLRQIVLDSPPFIPQRIDRKIPQGSFPPPPALSRSFSDGLQDSVAGACGILLGRGSSGDLSDYSADSGSVSDVSTNGLRGRGSHSKGLADLAVDSIISVDSSYSSVGIEGDRAGTMDKRIATSKSTEGLVAGSNLKGASARDIGENRSKDD